MSKAENVKYTQFLALKLNAKYSLGVVENNPLANLEMLEEAWGSGILCKATESLSKWVIRPLVIPACKNFKPKFQQLFHTRI